MNPRAAKAVDNWEKRWKESEKELETADLSLMFKNKTLMRGLRLTDEGYLERWVKRADELGIPAALRYDSDFGGAEGRISANAIRAACQAEALRKAPPDFEPIKHLLDIGGGYGALVRAIDRAIGVEKVTLIDNPVNIRLQEAFLTASCPDMEIVPYKRSLLFPQRFDVVVSTNTFGEMDLPEVTKYFDLIQRQIRKGGLFYNYNRTTRITDFDQYPYDSRWETVSLWDDGRHRELLSRRR